MNDVVAASTRYDWIQAEALLGQPDDVVPQEMIELVSDMVISVRQDIDEIETFPSTCPEQTQQCYVKLHQLRGNLLNFGFIGVADLVREYELAVRSSSAEEKALQLQNLRAAFTTNLEALIQRYPTLQTARAL